jgi:phosphohistidine phosphatase
MKLLVIRHGPAGDREAFAATGQPDDLRPLTERGRRKVRRAARGLRHQVGALDLVATSPLTRARETAAIVADRIGGPELVTLPELAPDAVPDALVPWLRGQAAEATVAVVGHEPHLGFLVGWLLTGRHASFVELRKGGACLLEFQDEPSAGGAVLLWALAPRQLRKLAP